MKKWVPLWSILIFLLIVGGLVLTYQKSLDPNVLKAQSTLAEKSAIEWSAKKAYFESLPSILVSGAYLVGAICLGIGAIGLTLSTSIGLTGMALTRVMNNGIGLIKETPDGGVQKLFIAAPGTVVAAHLGRISAGNSAGALPAPSVVASRRAGLPASVSQGGFGGTQSNRKPGGFQPSVRQNNPLGGSAIGGNTKSPGSDFLGPEILGCISNDDDD
jgi:hypothetical protein